MLGLRELYAKAARMIATAATMEADLKETIKEFKEALGQKDF